MKRLAAGVLAGTASVGLLLVVHFILGVVTGVIAICQSAPRWWVRLYPYAAVWVVPAGAILGVTFSRRIPRMLYRPAAPILSRRRVVFAGAYLLVGEWLLVSVAMMLGH